MAGGKIAAKVGRAACPHAAEGGVLAAKNAKIAKGMRPSGVEWLGDIPEGWEVARTKRNYEIVLGKMLCSQQSEENPIKTPYICAANVHFDGVDTSDLKEMWFSSDELALYAVNEGDLLVVEGGAGAGGAAICPKMNRLVGIQNSILVARNKRYKDNRFLRYFVEAVVKQGYVDFVCNKATIPHFTKEKLGNMLMPLPPLPEQRAIADYLDEKCGAIDAAIAEARKGIEEYKAWKKSLIFEAVNGDWEKRRLRFLADITTGNKDTQDAEPDGAYPFYVRSPIVERSTDYTFEGPGIMMAGDGAGAGRVFHYAVGKYAVHQRVYRIYNFRGIEGRFLLYSLGAIFPLEMDKGSAQSTVPSVRLPMLKDLLIPLPPLAEQLAIVDHLDEKCAAIDAVVTEKESLIADLEAYKKSLIYETVTGKREVA